MPELYVERLVIALQISLALLFVVSLALLPLKRRLGLVGIAACVILVLAENKGVAPDFSKYPKTESFEYFLGIHTNVIRNFRYNRLLVVSAFRNDDRCARQYFVTETGQEYYRREVYDWATQASRHELLSEVDLSSLRSAIRQLPAESVSPPIEQLVIVSFRRGTTWITRSYDFGALPKSMRQIYDILGERVETRKSK